jgi:hypothetical protein
MGYRGVVKSFVTRGNAVNDYDLRELSLSRFAIPLARAREIGGETSMSWTEFYATMRTGREFRFGTTFLTELFDMTATPHPTSSGLFRRFMESSHGLRGSIGRSRSSPVLWTDYEGQLQGDLTALEIPVGTDRDALSCQGKLRLRPAAAPRVHRPAPHKGKEVAFVLEGGIMRGDRQSAVNRPRRQLFLSGSRMPEIDPLSQNAVDPCRDNRTDPGVPPEPAAPQVAIQMESALRALRLARKVAVVVLGLTVVLIGVVMILTPGPAVIVIPAGLAILATEFLWGRKGPPSNVRILSAMYRGRAGSARSGLPCV